MASHANVRHMNSVMSPSVSNQRITTAPTSATESSTAATGPGVADQAAVVVGSSSHGGVLRCCWQRRSGFSRHCVGQVSDLTPSG